MKKLFISVPMKGRTKDEILFDIQKMHRIAEAVFDEKLEVIDSYIEANVPKDVNSAIYYLGESIKKMSEADYFIGVDSYMYAGCNVENQIAYNYDIPRYAIHPTILKLDLENHKCTTECVCESE